MTPACVIGLSGYSGSGKTTLIEKALPLLKREGLCVGVLKHTHKSLSIDTEGKDTDRFFRAGAEFVAGHDSSQLFGRYRFEDRGVRDALAKCPCGLDLVIVEGYKGSEIPGPRVWLGKQREKGTDADVSLTIFRDDPSYVDRFLEFISTELARHHAERSLMAGILIGGKSSRMGRPKHLLEIGGRTLSERIRESLSRLADRTVFLGSAVLPASLLPCDCLPDVIGLQGPFSGVLSAARWAPHCAWLISSVDMPFMSEDAWRWLLSQRRPGAWAVMPRQEEAEFVEMTGALYEPMIFDYMETLAGKGIRRLQTVAQHPKVIKPVIPPNLAKAWKNVNTPGEWDVVRALTGD